MQDIAVIGIANLFPGSSKPDQFWTQLLNKQDNRTEITVSEMGAEPQKYLGKKGDTDKFYCMYGGYIRDFNFDATPFIKQGINADYLKQLDAVNLWSLYVTEQALSDAGYWGSDKLQNCGLILGNLSFPTKSSNHLFLPFYHHVVENALQTLTAKNFQLNNFAKSREIHPDNGLIAGYPSALLAKVAGLGEIHFSLDAACASSCYSMKLACDYLHTGKADMMLAGAVSGADSMFVNMGFSIFQAFPANNHHAPFDQSSQGLFAAQGAGMMVLKRHSDALRDGDKIHAVIKGGALSNDGKGEFVLSPNSKGQILCYQRAYDDAQISPSDVDYIECHATGTPKGDKVELSSMETFFSPYNNKPQLGSAKSNLGHLLTAAGMPGMTKAIYALNQGKIPASLNLKNPISTKVGYLGKAQMPSETIEWPTNNKTRTAAVSVFGFGGSNAHLVLQGADTPLNKGAKKAKAAEPLAIIGMDCVVGGSASLNEFKQLINSKNNCFRELPTKRWKGLQQNRKIKEILQLSNAPKGAYIEQFDIDFLRFKIPPNDQDCLIPQQLLMMKVADNAAKDAGLKEGANVAVLVAMGMELDLHQYRGRVNLTTQIEDTLNSLDIKLTTELQEDLIEISKQSIASPALLNQYTSFIGNIMASRISALWDFSGPAFTVSSEENSVYRCVDIAENLMATSDVEAVIIASVDLAGSFENISLRQRYGTVNEQAIASNNPLETEGWIVGEGAGAFVLKPCSQVKDSQVYANINAVSFAQGCDAEAIKEAVAKACSLAAINEDQVDHLELFASGFAAENQAEKNAFATLYANSEKSSVKQQVGHLFNASGMVSIIKSALLLDNKEQSCYTAINGLGKDLSCAHLILSSSATKHQKVEVSSSKKAFSLIKPIWLGGDAIADSILNQQQNSLFSVIKTALQGKPLNKVINPINLDLLRLDKTLTPLVKTDKSPQTAYQIKQGSTMSCKIMSCKTSSEIFQQSKTHQAFLRSRSMAEQQIAKLIKIQAQSLSANVVTDVIAPTEEYIYPALNLIERFNRPKQVIYDTAALVEFAEGDISNVFGEEYKIIDSF